jgi:hypothetical protein
MDDQNNIIPFRYKNKDPNPTPQDTITVTKGSLKQTGKFVSMTDVSVTLLVNDTCVIIRNYDTLTINNKSEVLRYIKIDQRERPITVSYLFSEITWKAIGTGIITDSNINLRIASQINNTMDHNVIAKINCIAGSISNHRPMPHMMRALAVEVPMVSKVEDYTMYNLGERKLRQTTIIELGTTNYPIIKFYEHHTNQAEIRIGYRFKTSQFIPNMTIYMYTNDHKYLGSTDISEYQADEQVDLLSGATSLVRCETTIQVEEPNIKEQHITVEHLETKIVNHNKMDIALIIKHDLGPKKLIDSSCSVAKRRGHYLEWYFLIHPNTEETKELFSCTITLHN